MVSIGGPWWQFKDDDGTPYFFNEESKVTQWTKPTNLPDIPPPPPSPPDSSSSQSSQSHSSSHSHREKDSHRSASKKHFKERERRGSGVTNSTSNNNGHGNGRHGPGSSGGSSTPSGLRSKSPRRARRRTEDISISVSGNNVTGSSSSNNNHGNSSGNGGTSRRSRRRPNASSDSDDSNHANSSTANNNNSTDSPRSNDSHHSSGTTPPSTLSSFGPPTVGPPSPTLGRKAGSAFRSSGGVAIPAGSPSLAASAPSISAASAAAAAVPSVAIAIPSNGGPGVVINGGGSPPLISPTTPTSSDAVSWDQLQRKNAALSTIKAAMYSNNSSGPGGASGGGAAGGGGLAGGGSKQRIMSMQISRTQPLPDVAAIMNTSSPGDLTHFGNTARYNDGERNSPVIVSDSSLSSSATAAAGGIARKQSLVLSDCVPMPSTPEVRPETTFATMPPPSREEDNATPTPSSGGGFSLLSPRSRRKTSVINIVPSTTSQQPPSVSPNTENQEIKRADPQDAFEAKRAANRSAYTRSIVKPANTVDKSPAQEHYYRQMLLGEVLDTELEHTAHMRFVVDKFLQPARSSGLLSEKELGSMFGDIEGVRDASAMLVGALQARLAQATAGEEYECIGDAFAAVHGRLEAVLPDYCVGHEPARLLSEALFAEKPQLAEYFESLKKQAEADLSLPAYLIKPVQRVMKYPLLLAELLRYTPSDHRDRIALEAAHDRAKSLAHLINARKRDYEGRRRWAEIAPLIEATGDFDLVGDNRILLFEADLVCGQLANGGDSVSQIGTRRFWLCNDVLLSGKPRTGGKQKYKMSALFRLAPDASAVATHRAVNEKDLVNCFQIVSFARDAESLVLGFESERTRDEWFTTLQSLLRQAFETQRQRTALQVGGDGKPSGAVSSTRATASALEAMDESQRSALSDSQLRQHLTAAYCEFVSSESTFVEQLTMCVRRYLLPLRKLHMQQSELTQLFEAIERITPVHAQLVLPCVASVNPNADADAGGNEMRLHQTLAQAIEQMASNFEAHTQHAQVLDTALALYERMNSPGSPFNQFLKDAAEGGSVDDPDLLTLMHLPLTHVAEYAGLLHAVSLSTRHPSARAIVDRAEATASRLSASLQSTHNLSKLQSYARRIQGVPDSNPIVSTGRRFIAESPLKIGGKPHHAWLFNDRLVYGKPAQKNTFKYKGEFDLRDQTLIRNFIDTKSVSNAFELVRVADRTNVVCAMPDNTTKQAWMVSVSGAIREHMRAATRARALSGGDGELSQAAAAAAAANVAALQLQQQSSISPTPPMSHSPPLSPAASPRSSPAGVAQRRRLCEFCFQVPPVAKVVFTDGRPPLRTCDACTAVLNANPNARPPPGSGNVVRSASITAPRPANMSMSPPPTLGATVAMTGPTVSNPKAVVRRAQSVFQVAPSGGSGRGLLPTRPPRTALRTASPVADGAASPSPFSTRVAVREPSGPIVPGPLSTPPAGTTPPMPSRERRGRSGSQISGMTEPTPAVRFGDDSQLPSAVAQADSDKPPPLPPMASLSKQSSDVTSDDLSPPLPAIPDEDSESEEPPPPPPGAD